MTSLAHRRISSRLLALSAMAMLALFSGCSTDMAPTASAPSPEGPIYLAFSPEAARRAAKLATVPASGLTVSQTISTSGGKLTVSDLNAKGQKDDLEVTLAVPRGGLAQPTLIAMTVYGNRASDLVVAFEPSGLVFLKAAELKVLLGYDRVDITLSQLQAYHVSADGTVSVAKILSIKPGVSAVEVRIEVPGFSIYGLRSTV